jgi:hypothetical protein
MFPVRCELGFYIPETGILHNHCCENLRISRGILPFRISSEFIGMPNIRIIIFVSGILYIEAFPVHCPDNGFIRMQLIGNLQNCFLRDILTSD